MRPNHDPARVREDVRDIWIPRWVDQIAQDTRDAARRVRHHPMFALVIVATLALGIAVPTAIYSVVNAVLLRPLSYAHPDRMVWVTTRSERDSRQGREPVNLELVNEIDFHAWQQQSTSFDHLIAYSQSDATLVAGGEATRARVVNASDGFWDTSGARVILGGLPAATDRQAIVISHHLFVERFHSDPTVVGLAIELDGEHMTIAGVLAADFRPQLPAMTWRAGLDRIEPDVFGGMTVSPPAATMDRNTMVRIFQAIGQLKAGVTIEQARAELNTVHQRGQLRSAPFGVSSVLLTPLHERLVGASRRALTILLAAGLCVLLITCANVANLLLSRSSGRQKEMALRMSVGGGPRRVIRQLLAESVAYALLGGAAGVVLATWLVNVVVSIIGPEVPRLLETTVDLQVLAFAMAISLGTALLFGMGPAVALSRTNVHDVLKEGSRHASSAPHRRLAGRLMVAVQLALTVVLLTGAGVMVKSIWRMTSYPAGFVPDQFLTLRVDFNGPKYGQQPPRQEFARALLARAQTLPSVRDAALTTGSDSTMVVMKEGEPRPQNPDAHAAPLSAISAAFPRILGMTIVRGRSFDDVEPERVLLVNASLARRDFAGADPIGRRIRLPWFGQDGYGTIVGVVEDLKYTRLDVDATPEVFFPVTQTNIYGVTIALRVDGDALAAAPMIRKALAAVDPTQSIFAVRTMEQALAQSIAPRRFNLLLLGTFAFAAVFLAILGVYGVVAHAVAERRHEIGIRLALGAERRQVVAMIVGDSMRSVAAGLAIGFGAALGAISVIAELLYGVAPRDPPTFAASLIALAAIALVACATPALRAATVDPATALRAE